MRFASFVAFLPAIAFVSSATTPSANTTTSIFDPYAYKLKTVKCPAVDHVSGKNLTIEIGALKSSKLRN